AQSHSSSSATSIGSEVKMPCPMSERAMRTRTLSSLWMTTQAVSSGWPGLAAAGVGAWAPACANAAGVPSTSPPASALMPKMKPRRESTGCSGAAFMTGSIIGSSPMFPFSRAGIDCDALVRQPALCIDVVRPDQPVRRRVAFHHIENLLVRRERSISIFHYDDARIAEECLHIGIGIQRQYCTGIHDAAQFVRFGAIVDVAHGGPIVSGVRT